MLAAAAVLWAAAASAVPRAGRPPDIMFLLADDLGRNELGFMNGSRGLITPALDSLARGGVILRNYYVFPICSPTRSALMTGRYTLRTGLQSNTLRASVPWGVSLRETFLPQVMRSAGYATAMFGKWHLGMFREDYTPSKRGFDEYMGYYQGCGSHWTHVNQCCQDWGYNPYPTVCAAHMSPDLRGYDWFRTGPEQFGANATAHPDTSSNNTASTELIRDAAISYIERHKDDDRPFFMYIAFQNIHSPFITATKWRDLYANNTSLNDDEAIMFGYITEMDDAVGHILASFRESGRYNNSIIIFCSDNGAPFAGPGVDHTPEKGHKNYSYDWIARNYPSRGWKMTAWEGGAKVAAFLHSPLLPAAVRGTVSTEMYHVTDWLPTLARLSGSARLPKLPLDGHDIWDSVTTGGPSPRTEVLHSISPLCHSGQAMSPKAGLRVGRYKVVCWCYEIKGIAGGERTRCLNASADDAKADPGFRAGAMLFDLEADPAERNNLAADPGHAATLRSLLQRLADFADQSVEPMQWDPPYQGPSYECADCPAHPSGDPSAVWGPWL